jgi:hypothetical protein
LPGKCQRVAGLDLLLSFADDVAASNGVTLAGLLHAGADKLFEMFFVRSLLILPIGRITATPRPTVLQHIEKPINNVSNARGHPSPLPPQTPLARASSQKVGREHHRRAAFYCTTFSFVKPINHCPHIISQSRPPIARRRQAQLF